MNTLPRRAATAPCISIGSRRNKDRLRLMLSGKTPAWRSTTLARRARRAASRGGSSVNPPVTWKALLWIRRKRKIFPSQAITTVQSYTHPPLLLLLPAHRPLCSPHPLLNGHLLDDLHLVVLTPHLPQLTLTLTSLDMVVPPPQCLLFPLYAPCPHQHGQP